MKKTAVYCGASLGNEPIYQQAAVVLAAWMKENHCDLVYGGGNVGLMGTVADTLLTEGGGAIGVMPTLLMERKIAHNDIAKMHTVSDMRARKKRVIELADVYLTLPGGPGTPEEINGVISWGRVGEHINPCILCNVNGYYDLLAAFFGEMVETSFLTEAGRARVLVSDSLEEIGAFVDPYEPPVIRQYKKWRKR